MAFDDRSTGPRQPLDPEHEEGPLQIQGRARLARGRHGFHSGVQSDVSGVGFTQLGSCDETEAL